MTSLNKSLNKLEINIDDGQSPNVPKDLRHRSLIRRKWKQQFLHGKSAEGIRGNGSASPGEGGGTSIRGVHGGVLQVRVIFSRKNSEKGMSIFTKFRKRL